MDSRLFSGQVRRRTCVNIDLVEVSLLSITLL